MFCMFWGPLPYAVLLPSKSVQYPKECVGVRMGKGAMFGVVMMVSSGSRLRATG